MNKMIIVIIGIFLYLLMGTITLAFVLWHDRRCEDDFDKWIDDDSGIASSIIMLGFPFLWIGGVLYILFLKFPFKFAKLLMAIPITIIYVVKALIEEEEKSE